MRFLDVLSAERVALAHELGAPRTKAEVLRCMARLLARGASGLTSEQIESVLYERERLQSTGIGESVAIPHGFHPDARALQGAVLICPGAVPFGALDGAPVSLFFALLGPKSATGEHLKALARISRLLREPHLREGLLQSRTGREAYTMLSSQEGGRGAP